MFARPLMQLRGLALRATCCVWSFELHRYSTAETSGSILKAEEELDPSVS